MIYLLRSCLVLVAVLAVIPVADALADGDLLLADFDDGTSGAFAPRDDCWSVADGEYVCSATGYQYYSQTVARARKWEDYVFECDLTVEGSVNHMVFMRYQNPAKFYEVNVRGAPYNDVLIMKWAGRSQNYLTSAPCYNTAGEPHHYRIRLVGNRITVSFDGTQVLDYEDTTNPYLYGGVALVGYTGGAIQWVTAHFDNVVVSTAEKAAVATDQCSWDEVKSLFR